MGNINLVYGVSSYSSSNLNNGDQALHALNNALQQSSSRSSGSVKTKKVKVPKPVYPEKFHQKYTLPSGIEEQPF